MIYRSFQDTELSALGFGAMRMPVKDGVDAQIDEEKAAQMIDFAMENGINYYDTAWGYHGGNSEFVVGRALKKYPRDSFYLATKFPGYDLSNMPKVREIFEEQLKKLQVEYFDFYLFHNVCEMNIEQYLDPKFGIYDYLMEQKKNGRIRHLGFSCHGEMEVLRRFLEAYGKDMEFCQLQINYLDWILQGAKEKVELLKEYGIPVWVMEPLRGGSLAGLSKEQEEKLKALRPDEEIPAWAFRFLQSIPEITVTLSGMSNMEQLMANIKTFEEDRTLNDDEMKAVFEVAEDIMSLNSIPCTACHYCVSHCPKKLDIPRFIALYNEHMVTVKNGGFDFIAPMALSVMDKEEKPVSCVHCHSCEQVCPQNIKISDFMTQFSTELPM
ncbi:MAG: aldo/keto reductase [Lachnospiraceae bacterium]|nr:aldo/keto reductase [Lachnospiraceae bacterium]